VCGKKNADDFSAWCAFLEGLGYKNSIFVLNANQYGTPQERHRFFMISAKTHIRKPPHLPKANVETYLNIREGEQFYGIWDGYNHRVRRNKTVGTITRNVGADLKGNGQGVITYRNHELHIRSLYPIEAWRLMGFDDSDFNKAKSAGLSDTQLYKQAGNSIVVDVLCAIFRQML
jgi:DNA (cytosine-5)-methyltransferase 1